MQFRKAKETDLDAAERIYEEIIRAEEAGTLTTGWLRGVYPVRKTAEDALKRDDFFVAEDADGRIVGTGIINQLQVDVYKHAAWQYEAQEEEVMVLHTLVIAPSAAGKGYGTAFVDFYETYAKEHGCRYLRIDTNAKNTSARQLYKRLGYKEIDIVPTVFNGIPDVNLVLLEKRLLMYNRTHES